MEPAPKPRTTHRKTRTGCRTCKIRHVKCDEAKPACHKCSSTGRKCDGYEGPRTEWKPVVTSVVPVSAPAPLLSLQPGAFDDERSRVAFDYFRLVSSAELSRFSRPSLWAGSVLRLSHAFPAVRHAVLSVSTLHRAFKAAEMPRGLRLGQGGSSHLSSAPTWVAVVDPVAAQDYQRAVRQLIKDISSADKDRGRLVSLVCSILFAAIEVIQGNDGAALTHLESGIKLLQERPGGKLAGTTMISDAEEDIAALISRFDVETSLFVASRPPSLLTPGPMQDVDDDSDRTIPPFTDLSQASVALDIIMRDMIFFTRAVTDDIQYIAGGDVPLEVYHRQQCLLNQASRWDQAFRPLVMRTWTKAEDEEQTYLMQIHHSFVTVMLMGCTTTEETVYDSHLPAWREIIQLATKLNDRYAGVRTLSMETGIVYPLYWTAYRCRDGALRRQALAQLRRCSREGVWIPEIHSCVAEFVIGVEEAGYHGAVSIDLDDPDATGLPSCDDIPEFWRVHCVGINVNKEKRTVAVQYWRRLNGPDGEWNVDVEVLSY